MRAAGSPNHTPPLRPGGEVIPGTEATVVVMPETPEVAIPDSGIPQPAPLSPQHMAELSEAKLRAKKIRRAASTATFNAWSTVIFAAPAILFGLFDLTSFLVGAGLGIVAYNEYRGAKMFRTLDLRAPKMLGYNQIGLIVVLVIYSLWSIYAALSGENAYAEQIAANPQMARTLEPIGEMYKLLSVTVYCGVIVLSVLFQGFNSWYYFSRAKHLRAYLQQTPPWVVQMQRAAAGL